jgi:(1->4)-alpha-D-glucan 1-alpha-D-glucosylmutase
VIVLTPRSTYRVQVRPDFGFAATAQLTDYLADLGVTHLYTAPLLQAAPGSVHNYDVVDPTRANDQLGGEPGRLALVAAARERGLGIVVDIVPNHVGVAVPIANPAWWDLLKHGTDSRYARWFDIDWQRGRLLIPILADSAEALKDLRVEDGELRYFEHRFPLAPGTGEGTPQEVHDRQHYELGSWRRANRDLNYRRFFAVSTLAAVRVEDPDVFHGTHDEVLRWYARGEVDGIRVDHPDGLTDPGGYLARLHEAAPHAWLVVEKITEHGEELPAWPVAGTTGYDALREINGLFIDPAAEAAFTALDTELAGAPTDWPALVYRSKREVVDRLLLAELRRLARVAAGEPSEAPGRPDVKGLDALFDAEEALAELLSSFEVYRSYLPEGSDHLAKAVAAARRTRPDLAAPLDALVPRLGDPSSELALRFQQTSGAVMAKGVEDTAFYRWTRFIALNEVGGDPSYFGTTPADFHAAAAYRQRRWPASMTTLSTHDTKRSEDVRARLAVLAELPDDWTTLVRRWSGAAPLPDGSFAHLLWQTVVGAWPLEPDRLHAYLEKAAREANTSTGWDDPDTDFETAMHDVAERIYDDPVLSVEVDEFARRIAPYGWSNSLGQKVLQLAGPGVPDVYQGNELWDYSLVDPDNRRAVDFDARRALLARIDSGWEPPLDDTGAAKLLLVARALRLRRDRPELFDSYTPLAASGPAAEHAVAFDRGGAVAVATRLPVGLERRGGWGATVLPLPDGEWTDQLTGARFAGGRVPMTALLGTYPVALLARA